MSGRSTGAYYTKAWVAEFMLDEMGYTSDSPLWTRRLLEPSCGNGVFIRAAVERLISSLPDVACTSFGMLKDCIRAYDIDGPTVLLVRKAVMDQLISRGIEIGLARALIDIWINNADFVLIKNTEKFDYVVGNPPYVRATKIPREKREAYANSCKAMSMGTDLYVAFIEKGLSLLSPNGKLCYICSDRWLTVAYGRRLREYVSEFGHLDAIVRMHEVDAFVERVDAYPSVFVISRKSDSAHHSTMVVSIDKAFSHNNMSELEVATNNEYSSALVESFAMDDCFSGDGSPLLISKNMSEQRKLGSIQGLPTLEEAGVSVGIGIATGCDDVFLTNDSKLVERSRLMPLLYRKELTKGNMGEPVYLVNPWDTNGKLVDLNEYPLLNRYLEKNRDRLSKRYVARKKPAQWYRTIDKINPLVFGKPCVVVGDMNLHSHTFISDGAAYPHHSLYWLISKTWPLHVLSVLLESKFVIRQMEAGSVTMRGGTMRFQAQYLRRLHLPLWSDFSRSEQMTLCEYAKHGYVKKLDILIDGAVERIINNG